MIINNDLAGRMIPWEKVSQTVIEDLIPPPPPDAKKQSIASMEAINNAEHLSKVSNIFDKEHPPYSPDLAPSDFFLWGYLKKTVGRLNV